LGGAWGAKVQKVPKSATKLAKNSVKQRKTMVFPPPGSATDFELYIY